MVRRTRRSAPVLVLLPFVGGCLSMDPGLSGGGGGPTNGTLASDGSSGSSSAGGANDAGGDGASAPQCQNGVIIDPSLAPVFCTDGIGGGPIPDTMTPGYELPDGATSINACDVTEAESLAIRQSYCAACHENGADAGIIGKNGAPWGFVLDDVDPVTGGPGRLFTLGPSYIGKFGAKAIVLPGDPDHSALYTFAVPDPVTGIPAMPPPAQTQVGLGIDPPIPPMDLSDLGLLRYWIQNCAPALAGTAGGAPGDDGGNGAGDGGAGVGDGGDDGGAGGGGGGGDASAE